MPRKRNTWITTVRRFLPLVAILALSACSSPEQELAEHLAKTRQYLASDEVPLAAVEIRNALRLAPDDADVQYLRAQVFERQQDWSGVQGSLERAVALRPEFADAQRDLGKVHLIRGNLDLAEAAARKAIEIAPTDASSQALMAAVQLRLGTLDAARAAAERALELQPGHPEAMAALAAAHLAEGNRAAARQTIEAAIAQNPADRTLRLLGLQLTHAEGDPAKVIEQLEALIDEFPQDLEFYQALAAYQLANAPDAGSSAERTLRLAIERNPKSPEAKLSLAQLLGASDPGRAIETLSDLLASDAPDPTLRMTLADLYRSQGQTDRAADLYQGVAESNRGEAGLSARNELARIALQDPGQIDQAITLVEEVLALDPANADALLLRGHIHLQQDNPEAAQAVGTALAEARPDLADGYVLSAEAYLRQGLTTLARERLVRALEIDPGHSLAARLSATLLLQDGNSDKALSTLETAMAANPRSEPLAQALLELKMARGDYEGAQALTRGPTAPAATPDTVDYLAARQLASQGDFAGSNARLLAILNRNPEDLRALETLMANHKSSNDLGTLRVGLESVAAAHPRARAPRFALVELLGATGEPAKAIERLREIVAIEPKDLGARLLLASLLERTGEWSESMAEYEAVLAADPNQHVAANNLASLLLKQSTDDASAQRALELARTLEHSENPAFLDTLGWSLVAVGQYAAATETLLRALTAAPEFQEIACHLAVAKAHAGQPGDRAEIDTQCTAGLRDQDQRLRALIAALP